MNWRNYKIIEINERFHIRRGWIFHEWWAQSLGMWLDSQYSVYGFQSLTRARDAYRQYIERNKRQMRVHSVTPTDITEGEVTHGEHQTGSWK